MREQAGWAELECPSLLRSPAQRAGSDPRCRASSMPGGLAQPWRAVPVAGLQELKHHCFSLLPSSCTLQGRTGEGQDVQSFCSAEET